MVEEQHQTALSEFLSFLADFKSLAGVLGKVGLFAPFVDLLVNVGPPWPNRIAVESIMTVAQAVVLMWSFEFWWKDTVSKQQVRAYMKRAVMILVGLFILYMALFAFFVVEVPDWLHRDIVGFKYLPGIEELRQSDLTKFTDSELLERNERNPLKVWTGSSVNGMRFTLLLVWTALWVTFARILAAFLALQWRHENRKKG